MSISALFGMSCTSEEKNRQDALQVPPSPSSEVFWSSWKHDAEVLGVL